MADDAPEPVPVDSSALLGPTAIEAAVAALARRNQHHYAAMDEPERAQAVATWRDLAGDVLAAAHEALFGAPVQPNRAVLVFEDGGGEDIAIHASFSPQLEDIGGGQVSGSPAQITALSMLEDLQGEDGDGEPEP